MFHHHKQSADASGWVKMTGKMLDLQQLPGPRAPHPKLLTVELYPEGDAPVRAEVHLVPGDRHRWDDDLYLSKGDRTGFILNPATGEVRYDLTDPRNSMSAHTAAGEAWIAMDSDGQEAQYDTGPPWLVLGACPYCRRPVNQKMAALEPEPHCPSCTQILPAYPLVTSELRRQASS
jgi:hypothetical protein